MALAFASLGEPGYFDHGRLVEDLLHSAPLFARNELGVRRLDPPLAALTRLGQDILHGQPHDPGAWRLRMDPAATDAFRGLPFGRAYGGRLRFDWLMAAVILGRTDLRSGWIASDGGPDFDRGLRWLVLHGMGEHRLWRLLDRRFLESLRTAGETPGSAGSPLHAMVVAERPDLAPHLADQQGQPDAARLSRWLVSEGAAQYGLEWCLDERERSRLPLATQRASRTMITPRDLVDVVPRRDALREAGGGFERHTVRSGASLAACEVSGRARPVAASLVSQAGLLRLALPAQAANAGLFAFECVDLDFSQGSVDLVVSCDGRCLRSTPVVRSDQHLCVDLRRGEGPLVPGLTLVDLALDARSPTPSAPVLTLRRFWIT